MKPQAQDKEDNMEKFGSSKHFRKHSKFGGCSFGRENCNWKLEEQTNI